MTVGWKTTSEQKRALLLALGAAATLSGGPLPDKKGVFRVVARRWVVERTFAWLGRYRGLSKDYEKLTQTSAAAVQVSAIHHMFLASSD